MFTAWQTSSLTISKTWADVYYALCTPIDEDVDKLLFVSIMSEGGS